jgi:hypothetical protein
MTRYWISFEVPTELMGMFEYHGPWWVSGMAADESYKTVCAAMIAGSEDEAEQAFRNAFDDPKVTLGELRFCSERADEWDPFNGRFQRAAWMQWPITVGRAAKLRSTPEDRRETREP